MLTVVLLMDKMIITQTFTMARWQIIVKKQQQQNNNKKKLKKLYIQKKQSSDCSLQIVERFRLGTKHSIQGLLKRGTPGIFRTRDVTRTLAEVSKHGA